MYTISYINYIENEYYSPDNIYNNLDECKHVLNNIINNIISNLFNTTTVIDETYLFTQENTTNTTFTINTINTVNINKDTDIIIIKSDNEKILDIYKKKISKGYLYNSESMCNLYKFVINKYTENHQIKFPTRTSSII